MNRNAHPDAGFGILIVSQGGLARSLSASLRHVLGPLSRVSSICLKPNDPIADRREDIRREIQSLDSGSGTAVVIDICGASPCTAALRAVGDCKNRAGALTGANLPMLISLVHNRTRPLAEALQIAVKNGQQHIFEVTPESIPDGHG